MNRSQRKRLENLLIDLGEFTEDTAASELEYILSDILRVTEYIWHLRRIRENAILARDGADNHDYKIYQGKVSRLTTAMEMLYLYA